MSEKIEKTIQKFSKKSILVSTNQSKASRNLNQQFMPYRSADKQAQMQRIEKQMSNSPYLQSTVPKVYKEPNRTVGVPIDRNSDKKVAYQESPHPLQVSGAKP